MTCLKKIQNTEVFGSKFSSRTLTTAGDISEYSFKAVVKNIIQGKILEIAGIKNAGTINFDFSQLETLKKSTYQIEYWGDFGALGNEPFLLEELSIVSAENATKCTVSDNLNFEIKIEEISIPVTITKAINNFSLNIENLTPEQIALIKGEKGDKGYKGDAFTYADFTPTQIAQLQKPATDKVVELNELEANLTNSESIRVQNENTRVYSENIRNTNEQTRVNAENNRVSAETSRVNTENIRVTAETERVSNENLRKTAENARVSAETSRANAETTRENSENTRISNENSRVSAENTRVSNESGRVTAESARVAAELEREKNKPFNVKVTTPSSWVTGTLSETEIYRFSIPANTISSESILSIESMLFNKIGVNGFFNVKVKLTTSSTMPTGSTEQIGRSPNITANTRAAAIRKKFYVNGDVIKSQGFDSGLYFDEYNTTDVISTRTLDRTQTYNVIISVTLSNASDQVRLEGLDFNIK